MRAVLLAGVVFVVPFADAPARAQAAPGQAGQVAIRFEIAAQNLSAALLKFSTQSGIEVGINQELAAGKTAPALSGSMTPEAALRRLLEGSGLRFDFIDANSVRIARAPLQQGALAPVAGAPANYVPLRAPAPFEPPEEVVVTGTRIRGAPPVGSELLVLNRQDLLNSGRATVREILATQPQIQTVGAREESIAGGQTTVNNTNYGTGVNLRGLGADATLVLLNGRRIAPGGLGTFVDVSQIPLAALERVEILPDGASAIYGSDAVAGVVNFVTRRGYEGADTTARYGFGDGFRQYTAGQTIGTSWHGGDALISYEFYARTNLPASSRDYATADLRRFGGPDLRVATASPGTISANGTTYAIPGGQDGRSLVVSQLTAGTRNLQDTLAGTDLLPSQRRHAMYATLNQSVTDNLSVFADGIYSTRHVVQRTAAAVSTLTVPNTNPFFVRVAPGLASEQVQYSFLNDFGPGVTDETVRNYQGNLGANWDFAPGWRLGGAVSLSEDRVDALKTGILNTFYLSQVLADPNPATAFNPFGDGGDNNAATLARISGLNRNQYRYREATATGSLGGSLLDLPAGRVKISLGAEARRETVSSANRLLLSTAEETSSTADGGKKRRVFAAYGELVVPLVAPSMEIPFMHELSVSGAARGERYSDFGTSATPKLGLSWKPAEELELRTSWGRSFKAPQLQQLREYAGNPGYFSLALPNAASPTGQSIYLLKNGNNPALQPETSSSWSAGFDWRPSRVPGLTLSGTWFEIDYENRIQSITYPTILANTTVFSSLYAPSPSAADVNAIYASPSFGASQIKYPADQVVAIIDSRLQNSGVLTQRGFDLSASYKMELAGKTLGLAAAATRIVAYKLRQTAAAPAVSVLSRISNPVRTRAHAGVSWGDSDWAVGTSLNFVGGYVNDGVTPNAAVGSWTTLDLRGTYKLDLGMFAGPVQISVNVQNLFDRDPPAVANVVGRVGYDAEQATAMGRVISFELTKRW